MVDTMIAPPKIKRPPDNKNSKAVSKAISTAKHTTARRASQTDRDERLEHLIKRAGELFIIQWTRGSLRRLERLKAARSRKMEERIEAARFARIAGGS